MANAIFQKQLKNRIQDLTFAIDSLQQRLDSAADRAKVDLSAQLAALTDRRDRLTRRLKDLETQPDTPWANFKAQIAQEWHDLVRDIEERVEHLR